MQIGNNRPSGPRPEDQKHKHLDPDLTRANREGIEKATEKSGESTRKAIEERSPSRQAEIRQGRDTFERSKQREDATDGLEKRLRSARLQNTSARKAERVENAREQRSERIENARVQNTEARKAERVENARAQRTKALENAEGPDAQRVENARTQQRAERIENARVQNTEARKAERVESARSQRDKVEANRESLELSGLSRESVELSGSVERLMSDELPGVDGRSESPDARQARFEALREAYQSGELNSPERLRRAAARLLGGE